MLNYKSCFNAPDIWVNLGAVALIIFGWFGYWRNWNRNAEEFMPKDAPGRATLEGIRKEWELNYIHYSRKQAREDAH